MTMNSINPFTSRLMAALFAVLLSTTMVIGAVGPAYNGSAATHTQDYVA